MRGSSRRASTTSNSTSPEVITAANENSSEASSRSQSWWPAAGKRAVEAAERNHRDEIGAREEQPGLYPAALVGRDHEPQERKDDEESDRDGGERPRRPPFLRERWMHARPGAPMVRDLAAPR